MKKYIYVFFAFIFFSDFLFAKSYPFENQKYLYIAYYDDFPGPGFRMEFSNNCITLDIPEFNTSKQELGVFVNHTVKEKYYISEHNDYVFLHVKNKKYAVLYFEDIVCVLLDYENGDTLWGLNVKSDYVKIPTKKNNRRWIGIGNTSLSHNDFSSVLKEKINGTDVIYNGKSKYYLQIDIPWSPNNHNNGIGEWIEIEAVDSWGSTEFVIVNGFVRADKPDWYYNNARIKTAFIETTEGSWFITLKDTPHPQIIKLPKKVSGRIRLTIDDVYEGEKYKDVCLAGFYMLYKAPEKR